jgi:glycosyltransferase involved in cell wall biosynthesis
MAAIVRETGAGVVCDPTDPGSIAAALRTVLDAPIERRRVFRDAALAAAYGRYAWDRQVETLLGVYDRLERGRS